MSGNKLIINAALTGMVPSRADSPFVPITPDEIKADARRCRDAGAAILHLHARDTSGEATYRKDVYNEVLAGVREVCPDVILCVSTSGRTHKQFEQRSEVLQIGYPKPEMASLTLGSMNFARKESVNSPEMIQSLALEMQARGIVPEWECFEIGMVEYSHHLIKREILRPPYYCNILLGNLGTLSATRANAEAAVRALPDGVTWALAGIGRYQTAANEMAIEMGGHVRVGLEDNLWFDDQRTEAATNAALIERVADIAAKAGRETASPEEARAIIGLKEPALRPL